jgi:hypothetical protein
MGKTVIFLGKRQAPGSPLTQWPNAELWGTTNSNVKYASKRDKQGRVIGTVDDWTAWWDLHPFNPVPGYDGIKKKRPGAYQWYQTLPGPDQPGYRPLWLAELEPTIPAGVLFPKQRILDAFKIGNGEGHWFTCQVDLMMAYAILEGFEHIVLHGHGVSRELAHMIDHVGILYWIAVARERGIKVTVVPPSWYIAPKNPYGISAGNWGLRR